MHNKNDATGVGMFALIHLIFLAWVVFRTIQWALSEEKKSFATWIEWAFLNPSFSYVLWAIVAFIDGIILLAIFGGLVGTWVFELIK